MPYRFAAERTDYSDLASGKVFYNIPGHPAFPIRLASEVLQRCLARRAAQGNTEPCVLYDPCCGAAYHLSTLAYLHWSSIRAIVASDVAPSAVQVAQRNLELLTLPGLDNRIGELANLHERYGKESHQSALISAGVLRRKLVELSRAHPIDISVFQADAAHAPALAQYLTGVRVDIVLTDLPYGHHSQWQGDAGESPNPAWAMLDALRSLLLPISLVAVVSDKRQQVAHARYKRLERFQIGKRQAVILQPVASDQENNL